MMSPRSSFINDLKIYTDSKYFLTFTPTKRSSHTTQIWTEKSHGMLLDHGNKTYRDTKNFVQNQRKI